MSWPADTRPRTPLAQQEQGLLPRDWQPRWLDLVDGGGTGRREAEYRLWDDEQPAPDRRGQWPEIAAGQKLVRQINDWVSTSTNTDLSSTWVCYWGDTDPDRCLITLLD